MNHEHTDACFAGPFGRTIHPRCGTMKFDARDLPPGWWKAQEEDTMVGDDMLRDEIYRPYTKGPAFRLSTWVTPRTDRRGQTIIGYRLSQIDREGDETIFCGEDFAGSPLHADDSDETMRALLGFLTLRLGDTDREYFDRYSPGQLNFAISHGEMLALFAFELENGDETGLEFPAEEYE